MVQSAPLTVEADAGRFFSKDTEAPRDTLPHKPQRVLEKRFDSIRNLLDEDSDLKTACQWSQRLQSHLKGKAEKGMQQTEGEGSNQELFSQLRASGSGSDNVTEKEPQDDQEPFQTSFNRPEDASSSSITAGDIAFGNWTMTRGKKYQMRTKDKSLLIPTSALMEGSSSTFSGAMDFLENNRSGKFDNVQIDSQDQDFVVTRPRAPQKFGTGRQLIQPMLSGQLAEFRKFRSGGACNVTSKSLGEEINTTSQDCGANTATAAAGGSVSGAFLERGEDQLTSIGTETEMEGSQQISTEAKTGHQKLRMNIATKFQNVEAIISKQLQHYELKNEIELRRQKFATKLAESSAHQRTDSEDLYNQLLAGGYSELGSKTKQSNLDAAPIDESLDRLFDKDDDNFFVNKMGGKKQSLDDINITTTSTRKEAQSMREQRSLAPFRDRALTFLDDTCVNTGSSHFGKNYRRSSHTDLRTTVNDVKSAKQASHNALADFENSFAILQQSAQFEDTFASKANKDATGIFHESFVVETLSPRQNKRKTNTSSLPTLNNSFSLAISPEKVGQDPHLMNESFTERHRRAVLPNKCDVDESTAEVAVARSKDSSSPPNKRVPEMKNDRRRRRRHSISSLQGSSHHKDQMTDLNAPQNSVNKFSSIAGLFSKRGNKTDPERNGRLFPAAPPFSAATEGATSSPLSTPVGRRVRRASMSSLEAKPVLGNLSTDDNSDEDEAFSSDTNRKIQGLSPPPTDSLPQRRNPKSPETKQEIKNDQVNKIRRRRRGSISGTKEKASLSRSSKAVETKKETSIISWRRRSSTANKEDAELAAAELQKHLILSPGKTDKSRRKDEVEATPRQRDSKGTSRSLRGRAKARAGSVAIKRDEKVCGSSAFDALVSPRSKKEKISIRRQTSYDESRKERNLHTPVTPRRVRRQSIKESTDRSRNSITKRKEVRRRENYERTGSDSSGNAKVLLSQANDIIADSGEDESLAKVRNTPSAHRRTSRLRDGNKDDEADARNTPRTPGHSKGRPARRKKSNEDDSSIPFTPSSRKAKRSSDAHSSRRRKGEEGSTDADLADLLLSPSKRKDRRSTAHDLLKKNEITAMLLPEQAPNGTDTDVVSNTQTVTMSQLLLSPSKDDFRHPSTKEREYLRRQVTPDSDGKSKGRSENASERSERKARRGSIGRDDVTTVSSGNNVVKSSLRRRHTEGTETISQKRTTYRRVTTAEHLNNCDGSGQAKNNERSPKSVFRRERHSADVNDASKRSHSRSCHTRSTRSGHSSHVTDDDESS